MRAALLLLMATLAGVASVCCTLRGAAHPLVAEQVALLLGFAALLLTRAAFTPKETKWPSRKRSRR